MKYGETLACAALLWCGIACSRADYLVSLGSRNSPVQMGTAGQSFDLDLVLASDRDERNNSVIVRIEFSTPGLSLESYQWYPPYGTADGNDDSKPALSQLPKVLGSDILTGPGYPADAVDIELSNATGVLPGFASGRVAKLVMKLPVEYRGPELIRIRVLPDSIADGFEAIPARVEQDFFLLMAAPVDPGPKLEIHVFDGTPLILWPLALEGYELEATENLSNPAGWKRVNSPVFEVGDRKAVLLAPGSNYQFFRLRGQ